MGQTITTQIEIAAPPETVRAVFLDFPGWKQWHQQAWMTITPHEGKSGVDLQPGDKITVDLAGTSFNPPVVENTTASFQWIGSLFGLLDGKHQFQFSPSQTTPGGTTLLQKEDFSGPMAIMFKDGWSSAVKTKGNFEALNRDLKAAAEQASK